MKLQPIGIADLFVRRAIIIILLINSALLIFLGVTWNRLPPQVPLLYSLPWGEAQIVPRVFLFMIPGVALLFAILSGVGHQLTSDKNIVILRILWGGCLATTVLGSLTVVRIVLLIW